MLMVYEWKYLNRLDRCVFLYLTLSLLDTVVHLMSCMFSINKHQLVKDQVVRVYGEGRGGRKHCVAVDNVSQNISKWEAAFHMACM